VAEPDAYGRPPPIVIAPGDVHPAAKRRRYFDSVQDMESQLSGKGAYHLFEPRMFHDYCRYGLLARDGGGYELACPPEIEAAVYMASRTNAGVYDSARSLEIPVRILRGKPRPRNSTGFDFSASPTWSGFVDAFKIGVETQCDDWSHFIPMQIPELVIEAIRAEVAAWQCS
jgi:hypothetical protein